MKLFNLYLQNNYHRKTTKNLKHYTILINGKTFNSYYFWRLWTKNICPKEYVKNNIACIFNNYYITLNIL